MYKIVNGVRVPLTDAEVAAHMAEQQKAEAEEIRRKQEEYEASLIVDDFGNKYKQTIVDGKLGLILVESADGTLNI